MKFIRDIIGEKRQMAHQNNGASAANGVNGQLESDLILYPETASEVFKPQEETQMDDLAHDGAEMSDVEPDPVSELQASGADEVAEGLADFFAQQEDIAKGDAEPVIEPAVATKPTEIETPKPTKLVVGKAVNVSASEDAPQQPKAEDASAALDDHNAPVAVDAENTEPARVTPMASSLRTANTGRPPEDAPEQEMPTPAPVAAAAPAEPSPLHSSLEDRESVLGTPTENTTEHAAPSAFQPVDVPQPAMGRGASRQGRVKTRLLGFNISQDDDIDPISGRERASAAPFTTFPVGWLIVTDGPGRGSAFTLFDGVSKIGRGKDQTVQLDFGDNSISRENHAAIAYDPAQKSFYIGHGGKANLVRRNDRPVLSTEELSAGDRITIGETMLQFVPLCGAGFTWDAPEESGQAHASNQ